MNLSLNSNATEALNLVVNSFCAPVYITEQFGRPEATVDEQSWVSLETPEGRPVWDIEVNPEDTGDQQWYDQTLKGDRDFEPLSRQDVNEAIYALRIAWEEADKAAWIEYLEDKCWAAIKVYYRDFANTYNIFVGPKDALPNEGDIYEIGIAGVAEHLVDAPAEWMGGVNWTEFPESC